MFWSAITPFNDKDALMTARTAPAVPTVVLSRFASPVDTLHLATVGKALIALYFDSPDVDVRLHTFFDQHLRSYALVEDAAAHASIHRELDRYFTRGAKKFATPIHLFGTDFQMQVWTALRSIPHGATMSYKALAEVIGNPAATRAVGGAVGRNPISIVIPCHRVIGEDGSLTGFGGGIERKKVLLRLEGVLLV